jgi:hypothetical protein
MNFKSNLTPYFFFFARKVCAAFALTMLFLAQASAADTTSLAMTSVKAETLSEVKINLPEGLPAERTLVMMGFEFDHQKTMDDWVEKMKLRAESRPWLQLHVIGSGFAWLSGFINSRKRQYFPDDFQRERVVPVYVNTLNFITAMGLPPSPKSVYVVVVRRDGQVLASAQGGYDPLAAQMLSAALDAP